MNPLAFTHRLIVRWRKARVRENRRTRHRSRRSKYAGGFLLAASLGVLDLGWSVLVPYATHHPYFTVGDITVDSDGHFSEQEIQEWSGLTVGMNLWEVDPPQVEARLLARPWIQTAEVKREFPQRVSITVKPRRAVAIVTRPSPTYLDDTGVCFPAADTTVEVDLPYVSGFAALPLDTPAVQTALAEVLHLLSLTRLWQQPLSEIYWDPHQGYTLFLARRRVTIRLGWETTPEKVAQVGVALQTWPPDGPPALFDARFVNQVIVRPYTDEHGQSKRDLTGPL
jgi:cell division septal protein FtsQ